MLLHNENVILCPPDRLVPVDYMRLRYALQQEVGRCSSGTALLPVFQQLLLLLENITHMQYLHESWHIKSAMTLLKPLISRDEQQSSPNVAADTDLSASSVAQAAEQQLLDAMIDLLLEARYSPLTAYEWDVAQQNQFTFDIPVRIDWSVLDDQMLSDFWQRHEQLTAANNSSSSDSDQGASSSSSSLDVSSSSSIHSSTDDTTDNHQPNIDLAKQQQFGQAEVILQAQQTNDSNSSSTTPANSSSTANPWQQQQKQQTLTIDKLPEFFDRLLVFHRGVGVATSEGLYLGKKVDLLLGYLFVDPIVDAWQQIIKQAAAVRDNILSTMGVGDGDDSQRRQQPQVLRPFAAADLGHVYVRSVVRQSLRVIMPGPAEVIRHLGDQLTLVEPTFKDVVVVYRATSVKAAAANNSNRSASVAAVESAVTAAISATSGAATAAADAVADAAAAVGEATAKDDESSSNGSNSSNKSNMNERPDSNGSNTSRRLQQQQQQQQSSDSSDTFTPGTAELNPYNIVIKSFSDVALADLELVFPSKRAEVQPTTLVRSALMAAGAIVAAAAYIHKSPDGLPWSLPVVVSAAGVVAGRALRVLSTVRGHQARLNDRMMRMQYNAAQNSQEGVAVKLVDELRDQHLKEAALVLTVMIMQQQQQQEGGSQQVSQNGSSSSSSDGSHEGVSVIMSARDIDTACEEFLLHHFGVKVDVILDDTLPRMLDWGLLRQHDLDMYSIPPLQQALTNLQQYWISSTQQQQQQQLSGANGSKGSQQQPAASGHGNSSRGRATVAAATATSAVGRNASRSALSAVPDMQLLPRRLYPQQQQQQQRRVLHQPCMAYDRIALNAGRSLCSTRLGAFL